MTKEQIFELYKKVQNKDKKAENMLIDLHKVKYPNSPLHLYAKRGSCSYSRDMLHTMYLHLYK